MNGRSAEARRRLLATVLVLSLAFVGAAWALASPVGSSPDDDFHLPSIWCASSAPDHLCRDLGPSTRDGFRSVEVASALGPQVACYRYQMFESGACQDLAADGVIETAANEDLYPGGYYFVMGFFARDGVAQSVVLMRLINFALCVGMLAAAVALAPARIRRSAVVGALVTSVPMALFLFSSTNPSGVVVAAIPTAWITLHSLLEDSDRRTRIARIAVLVFACGLALTSRSDAGVFLVLTAVAVAFAQPRDRLRRLMTHRVTIVLLVVSAIFIALALVSRFPNAGIGIGMQKENYDRSLGEVFFYNFVNLPLMWTGSLGGQGLGWLDTPIPVLTTFVTVSLVVLVVALGAKASTVGGRRAVVWMMGMLFVIPFYVMATDRSLVGEIFQARYLLPLLPVLVMAGLESTPFARGATGNRSAMRLGAAALGLAQAVALHANMRRYVTGVEVRTLGLDANREWWWPWGPSANLVLLMGTIGFAAVCFWIIRWLESGKSPI